MDLDSLSTEELQEYLNLLEVEQEQRRVSPITCYAPHPGQELAHSQGAVKVLVVEAGNRQGKSHFGAAEAVAHMLGERLWLPEGHEHRRVLNSRGDPIPVPNKGLVAGESFGTGLRETIIPKLIGGADEIGLIPQDMIDGHPRKNAQGIIEHIKLVTGSTVRCMAYNQDPKEFESTSYHWAWFDEPPPESIYIATRRGLVDYSGRMWLTMTPLKEPWIHQEITSQAGVDPRIAHIRFKELSNPYVPREELLDFLRSIKDPAIREARLRGTPLHLQGLVFPEWKSEPPYWIQAKPIPHHWVRIMGIDPHPRKPTALLWIAISPDTDNWYCYRELFDPSLKKVKDIVRVAVDMEAFEDIDLRVIDWSSRENDLTSEVSVFEQFEEYFYRFRGGNDPGLEISKKTDKMGGIELIHGMLSTENAWGAPQLKVMDCCPTVRQNFMNHIWQDWAIERSRKEKDPKPEVVKKNDDMIDLIRYLRMEGEEFSDFRAVDSLVDETPTLLDIPRLRGGRTGLQGRRRPVAWQER